MMGVDDDQHHTQSIILVGNRAKAILKSKERSNMCSLLEKVIDSQS